MTAVVIVHEVGPFRCKQCGSVRPHATATDPSRQVRCDGLRLVLAADAQRGELDGSCSCEWCVGSVFDPHADTDEHGWCDV